VDTAIQFAGYRAGVRVLRAALHNRGGGDTEGASTLTMQYVKQVRYYQASTDWNRRSVVKVKWQLHRHADACAQGTSHRARGWSGQDRAPSACSP
jgi:hypothetical protein